MGRFFKCLDSVFKCSFGLVTNLMRSFAFWADFGWVTLDGEIFFTRSLFLSIFLSNHHFVNN